jgi:hypothetical protein
MTQLATMSYTPRVKDDPLTPSMEQLRHALDSREPGQKWVQALGRALARAEDALRTHVAVSESADGPLAEVRKTQPPLTRQTTSVTRGFRNLLQKSTALRGEVKRATEAAHGTADVETIRRRAEKFLAGFREAKEAETVLILDSVNTDIGVGD